jgi:hypothetical protein
VVLHDHGVSRRHARIFARGGRYYVMDLGSSRGTLLNGKPLGREKEQELHGGDRLAMGPLEFLFTPLSPTDRELPKPAPAAVRPRSSTLITRAQTQDEVRAMESEDTGPYRTVPELAAQTLVPAPAAMATLADFEIPTIVHRPAGAQKAPAPPAPKATIAELEIPTIVNDAAAVEKALAAAALAAKDSTADTEVSTITRKVSLPSVPPLARAGASSQPEPKLSAAERARLRRERRGSLFGQLLLWWEGRSLRVRAIAGVMTGVLLVAAVGVLFNVFRAAKEAGKPRGPEPTLLQATPIPDSFGLGEGVTWDRPDLKEFHFEFASPTRAVAVLHYQASDISQSREVSLSLNGVEVGWIPSDSAETDERELQQLLPLSLLRRDAPNWLVFDNTRNPPGEERWRVWNMYVEVIPVPELSAEQLLSKAREQAATARRFHEQKDVGLENLFKSWKLFRSAWITLEALEKKPELYEDVRYGLAETARELDQECRRLMLDFQRSVQYRDGDKALKAVQEVLGRFPTTEHRCHNLAIEKATEYELPI